MDLNLKNRVALVTGSGQGIGRAIAMALAAEGANIAVVDINAETAAKTAVELQQMGVKAESYIVDITDYSAVEKAVAEIVAAFGRIDILVNNAGISKPAPIQNMSVESWKQVMDVNLNGVFYCSKAVFPYMMNQKYGRILSIASFAGKRGTLYGDNVSYSTSKTAVMGFTVALAFEGARYGITVNAVAPGAVETDLMKLHTEERRKAIADFHLLKRMGKPEEVAALITYLASDQAAFITGETVDINGGLYLDL
jgi:NAD(P)-dependent dehydrogenase (short-subunit alcohol dehydrogenase family)